MSAAEFLEQFYDDLPSLFTNEGQLRELWSKPDTRRKLLEGLGEKGYGTPQLSDLTEMVDAENSDLYDVLAYIAFTSPPLSREARVASHRDRIFSIYRDQQREFLRFVLDQYIISLLEDTSRPCRSANGMVRSNWQFLNLYEHGSLSTADRPTTRRHKRPSSKA